MKNVIIAKDVHDLLVPEKSFLGRSDLRIRTAESNSRALALHRAEKADLIISHLDNDLSGESLCRQIREDADLRTVSILLVCGGQEAEIARCINCNANAYITMPFNSAVLLQEAHRLLNIPPRKACRIPVKIRMECETRGKRFTGTIEDISTAGLFFRTAAALPEGATVHCTFAVSGSRQLTVQGEVARIAPGAAETGYGVSFFDISTEAVSAIGRLFAGDDTCP